MIQYFIHHWWAWVLFIILIGYVLLQVLAIKASKGIIPNDKELLRHLMDADYVHTYPTENYINIRATSVGITSWSLSLLCRFEIMSVGVIPRWYKSHRYMKKIWNNVYKPKEKFTKKYTYAFGKVLPTENKEEI